jgi:uncharacterized protein YtpQ (UPF0354 family)
MFGLFSKKARPAAPSPQADAIVPRVKHEAFLDAIRGIGQEDPNSIPVTRPFVADLLITYAFDLPDSFIMVSERDRKRLHLSMEQLHDTAMTNLRRTLPPVQLVGSESFTRIAVGNHLEGCLLLIDRVWKKVQPMVNGQIVVAAPTRDVMLFTGSDNPAGIEMMRQFSASAAEHEPTHNLTQELLVRVDGAWLPMSDVQAMR